MTEVLQIVFDALSLGSLYALGALGIALIFGVMRLVNFAHGDFIAFCVFAMLWPSINAAAIVFAGNLPFYLLDSAAAAGRGRAVHVVGGDRLPPFPQHQSGDDDDRFLRAGLCDPAISC